MDSNLQTLTAASLTGHETFQLLVTGQQAAYIADDWTLNATPCDLRLRRARTPAHIVIECTDPIFAARIVKRFDARLHIKP